MLSVQADKEVVIVTSYETAMRTAHNFLAVFLKKSVGSTSKCPLSHRGRGESLQRDCNAPLEM